jgi:hypothetical protein
LISRAVGIGGVEIEIGDDRRAALRRKAQCDFFADAACRAGNDRDLSIETGHAKLLSRIFQVIEHNLAEAGASGR